MAKASDQKKNQNTHPDSPPELIPPDAMQPGQKESSRTPLLLLGGGLLLIIAAVLVLILPLMQEQPTSPRQLAPHNGNPALQPAQPKSPVVSSQSAVREDSVREIETLSEVWLKKQAEAEARNVAAWGGEDYARAVTLAKECDQNLVEKQYLATRQACQSALDSLEELMASRDRLLEEALAAAAQAIEQGKPEAAIEEFKQALAINANDERAATGLRRAEQLPVVLQLLQDGLTMESAGDPDGALSALTEATSLDPEFSPAREALVRVQATIAERAFEETMSHALQAMTVGKLAVARVALQKAATIKPGDPAVRDLKQQLDQAQLSARLTSLQQDVERMEQQERWPEALKSCQEALALDAHAAFAVSCKERTSLRVDLDSHLKTLLAKPERLFEEGPRQEAEMLLSRASTISPRGPRMTAQLDQLEGLLTQAQAKVEVVLLSDNLTDVTIYHVGKLGRFEEKHLVLPTGNYIATGSRDGFRDIRQALEVRPGSGKLVFTLRCEEPI